jgi:hypothetical protein
MITSLLVFTDDHRFGAVGETFESASNQRELRVAPVDLPGRARRHSALLGEHNAREL